MVDVQFLRDEILKQIRETGHGSLIKAELTPTLSLLDRKSVFKNDFFWFHENFLEILI